LGESVEYVPILTACGVASYLRKSIPEDGPEKLPKGDAQRRKTTKRSADLDWRKLLDDDRTQRTAETDCHSLK
jgi:hypothetical protein